MALRFREWGDTPATPALSLSGSATMQMKRFMARNAFAQSFAGFLQRYLFFKPSGFAPFTHPAYFGLHRNRPNFMLLEVLSKRPSRKLFPYSS